MYLESRNPQARSCCHRATTPRLHVAFFYLFVRGGDKARGASLFEKCLKEAPVGTVVGPESRAGSSREARRTVTYSWLSGLKPLRAAGLLDGALPGRLANQLQKLKG